METLVLLVLIKQSLALFLRRGWWKSARNDLGTLDIYYIYYATQKELPPDTGLGLFTISSRQSSTEFHFQMTFIDSAALPWRNCKQSEPGVTGYFFLGRIVVTRSPNHLSAYSLSIKEIISWFILLSLLSVQPTYFLLFVSYLHVCISYPHISSFSW